MAVHSGVFHADVVFSVAMMKGIIADLEVVRTRDEDILATCDLVADVGGGAYDHHQMDKKLREDGIPYCAFGLVWQDFGGAYVTNNFEGLTEEQVQEVVDTIAYEFITQIDASDNGVDVNTYEVPITTISQVISSFMPHERGKEVLEEGFEEAVKFASVFLKKVVRKEVESYTNFNHIKALIEAQPIEEKHYLVLDESVAWKEAVLKLDEEEKILFVVFEDIGGSWRTQTVPKVSGSFEARRDLPEAWGGLRDEEMDEVTGMSGCIFCHPGRFICGHQTKEGAIALAELAVK